MKTVKKYPSRKNKLNNFLYKTFGNQNVMKKLDQKILCTD